MAVIRSSASLCIEVGVTSISTASLQTMQYQLSKLIAFPSCDVTELFACYDDILRSLTDILAPLVKLTRRQRSTAPWCNAVCRAVMTETHRLEHVHCWFRSSHTMEAWKRQSRFLQHYLQEQFKDYWTTTVGTNLTNSKLLCSKVSLLLHEAPASDEQSHSADDFAAFFHEKIEKIRQLTLNTLEAVIEWLHTPILDMLRPVMPDEHAKIIAEFPTKQCSLDPIPT